jgi:hypothetical protein
MNPGGTIYTIDEFRCWKVENLNDERSDENKNEGGGYPVVSPQKVSRFAPLNRYYMIIDEVFFDNLFIQSAAKCTCTNFILQKSETFLCQSLGNH